MTVTINGTTGYNGPISSVGSISSSGNLTFTGVGAVIAGDFSNATLLSRTVFQTTTANSSTGIYALPSGTSTAASWQATNAADPTNASKILIATNGSTDVQLVSGRNGTGTYLPLTFYTNGSEQMRLDTGGNFGLGVTPSAWSTGKAFEVGAVGNSLWAFSSADVYLTSNAYYNTAWKYASNNVAGVGVYEINGAIHYWYRAASGTANATASLSTSMVLDANGNLGLGVAPTNNTLGKSLQVGQAGAFVAESGSNRWWLASNWYYNGGDKYINNGYATIYTQQTGTHQWLVSASGTAGAAVTFTQAMTLTAGGILGIATSSPWSSSILDVNGNTNFRSNMFVGVSSTSQVLVNKIFPFSDLAYNDGANTTVTDTATVTSYSKQRLSSAPSNGWFYGPYYDLAPGNYVAKFRLKVANNASSSNILYIDCAGVNITTNPKGNSAKQLQPNLFAASNVYQYFDLYFTKTAWGGYLETRGLSFVTGITDMYIDHILIQPA